MRKKVLLFFVLIVSSTMVWADTEVGNLKYTTSDGLATVTGLSSAVTSATAIDIPSSVMITGKIYPVTTIGEFAFISCHNLSSVNIPRSVTSIEKSAFSFSSLTSITFEANSQLLTIGESAFMGSDLPSIDIPNSVTSISEDAFMSCKALTTITFEANSQLTTIGNGAFFQSGLISIEIPKSVTTIENTVFKFCYSLTSVTFESNSQLKTIGESAFYKCTSLASIDIPSSVESIGKYLFYGCTNLASFNIPSGVTEIGISAFEGCTSLTSIDIHNKVEKIAYGAFSNCTGLTAVNIGSGVTEIGISAFEGCTSLTSVTLLGTTVPSLSFDAFKNCNASLAIYVPVGYIDNYAETGQWSDLKDKLKAKLASTQIASGDFAGYWSTYYDGGGNVEVDANTDIYYVSAIDGTSAKLTKNTTDKVIPYDQAVLLKSTAAEIILSYTSAESSGCAYSGNKLEGVYKQTTISTSAHHKDKVIYTLANGENGLGFYKYYDNISNIPYTSNSTLAANKAFLALAQAVSANAFIFNLDETTDVSEKVKVNSEKFSTNQYYTLDGRLLSGKPAQRGIYINNGRKVIVK